MTLKITSLKLQPHLQGTNDLPTMVYNSSYQLCQEDQLQAWQTSPIAFPEIWSKWSDSLLSLSTGKPRPLHLSMGLLVYGCMGRCRLGASGYPSRTHLKTQISEITLAHNVFLCSQIVSELCTEHISIIVAARAKFRSSLEAGVGVMEEQISQHLRWNDSPRFGSQCTRNVAVKRQTFVWRCYM